MSELPPPRPPLNPPAGAPAGMHGRPTIGELVEAVREFLEHDVMAATDGRVQFHGRVAANVLAMVERELSDGPEQQRAHSDDLARLGEANDAELARAIRAGKYDGDPSDVRAVIERMVTDRLRVANPKYLR